MVRLFDKRISFSFPRSLVLAVACSVLSGFLAGTFLAVSSGSPIAQMLFLAAECPVSLGQILAVLLLPVLFTAFAFYISCLWLIVPIAFFKTFCLAYLYVGLASCAGEAGMLVGMLLMFSDLVSLPALCWLWIHLCLHNRAAGFQCVVAVSLALCGIGFLDYQFVSPFLANLIS